MATAREADSKPQRSTAARDVRIQAIVHGAFSPCGDEHVQAACRIITCPINEFQRFADARLTDAE